MKDYSPRERCVYNAIGILLLLLFFPFASNAQLNLDSLRSELGKVKPDSLTIEKHINAAANMGGLDPAAVKLIANWGIEKSRQIENKAVEAHATYILGRIYLITDDHEEAMRHFTAALRISQKHGLKLTEANCYEAFGNICSLNKQYTETKKNYSKALALRQQYGTRNEIAMSCFNLASLVYESQSDSNYVFDCVGYLNQALSQATDTGNPDVYVNAMGLKAFVYSKAGWYDSVPYFLDEAERVTRKLNYVEYTTLVYYYRAWHFFDMHKTDEAIRAFEAGLNAAREGNSMEWVKNFYAGLSDAYAQKGNYEKALFFYTRHKEAYDSVVNQENFNKVLDLRHLYENEKKEKELAETKKAKAIGDFTLEKELRSKSILVFLLVGIGIIALLFSFLIVSLRKNIRERKKAYLRLEEKNTEILVQSEKLVVQSREIALYQSQMNPHFVFNALNSIQGHIVHDEKEKTLAKLRQFTRLMRQTLNNSDKDLISLSTEIDYLNLYFSFEKDRFASPIRFNIVHEIDIENILIPPMLIQPFIENALKHAGLDNFASPVILLRLVEEGELLVVSITDNGMGIQKKPEPQTNEPRALGIVRSRILLLFETKGVPVPVNYLSIDKAPGLPSGTEVRFCIPLLSKF
jgi:tetratricopeptide (TPR) repeat protein